MRRKRRGNEFEGWGEEVDTTNLDNHMKKLKIFENEVREDTLILEAFKSSYYNLLLNAARQMKIQTYIDSFPAFTTDLRRAAEFVSEFMYPFDDIDSSVGDLNEEGSAINDNISEMSDDMSIQEVNTPLTVSYKNSGIENSVKKLGIEKKICPSNIDAHLQPVISLTRLNIPKPVKKGMAIDFTINLNSSSYQSLFANLNTSRIRVGGYSSVKPQPNLLDSLPANRNSFGRMKNDDDFSLCLGESDSESFTSGQSRHMINNSHIVDMENQDPKVTRPNSETTLVQNQDISSQNDKPEEEITHADDKIIDTFFSVMRKTTNDSSILAALQRDFLCEHCNRGFLKKYTLRKHMIICSMRNDGADTTKKLKKYKTDKNFHCRPCGHTYVHKYSLYKHNELCHNLKRLFKCLVCSWSFYNEEALMRHCRSRHGLAGSNPYKCPYCTDTFNVRGDLTYHCRKKHNGSRCFVCSICLKAFKNKNTCKLHEQDHGYSCDICMFTTKKESELIAHGSTHLHMVVYKCDKCTRAFKGKRDFSRHIKIHEREKI